MVFHALHGDFVGPIIGSSVCLLNRFGGNVLHHSSSWSLPHFLRWFRAVARRRLNVVDNPLRVTSERSSFCKGGFPDLRVRFALPCFCSFPVNSMSLSRTGWTPHDGLSHSFHVLRGSCSCNRTRWFILHYRSPCSTRCDPPQDGIVTWNVPMMPNI